MHHEGERGQQNDASQPHWVRLYQAAQSAQDAGPGIPDIEAQGPFKRGDYYMPGEYSIDPEQKTITWNAVDLPWKGGMISGAMVSAYTPDNIRRLEAANYLPGDWNGIRLKKLSKDARARIAAMLNSVPSFIVPAASHIVRRNDAPRNSAA